MPTPAIVRFWVLLLGASLAPIAYGFEVAPLSARLRLTATAAQGVPFSVAVIVDGLPRSRDCPEGRMRLVASGTGGPVIAFTDLFLTAGMPARVRIETVGDAEYSLSFDTLHSYLLTVNDRRMRSRIHRADIRALGGSFDLCAVKQQHVTLDMIAGWSGNISLEDGSFHWKFGLGRLPFGVPMSALSWYIPAAGDWSSLTPIGLHVLEQPGGLDVVRDARGAVRQLLAPSAGVDVVRLGAVPGAPIELRFYPRTRVQPLDPATGLHPMRGFPFVTYRLEPAVHALTFTKQTRDLSDGLGRDAPAGDSAIGIEESGSTIAFTEVSTLARTVSGDDFKWVLTGWHLKDRPPLVERTWELGREGDRLIEVGRSRTIGSSRDDLYTRRVFTEFPWGWDVTFRSTGSGPDADTATIKYYDSKGSNYGLVRSAEKSDGSWEVFEYHPDRYGAVTAHHKPFADGPAAPPSDLAANDSWLVDRLDYADTWHGRFEDIAKFETSVGGIVIKRTLVSYARRVLHTGQPTLDAVRDEYANPTSFVRTVTRSTSATDGSFPMLERLVDQVRPDGDIEAWVYQWGRWDGAAFVPDRPGSTIRGPHFRMATIHATMVGDANQRYPDDLGYPLSGAYLEKDKSTREVHIFNELGLQVYAGDQTWGGTRWEVKNWTTFVKYDLANRLVERKGGATASLLRYRGDRLTETNYLSGPDSRETYDYDSAGRLETKRVTRVDGIVGITRRVYDAEDRVIREELESSRPSNQVIDVQFDDTGRATRRTHSVGTIVNTETYIHDTRQRRTVWTDSAGNSKIEFRNLAGETIREEETGATTRFTSYRVEPSGLRRTRVTEGSPQGRLIEETWTDGLDRDVRRQWPSMVDWGGMEVTEWTFDNGTPGTNRILETRRSRVTER